MGRAKIEVTRQQLDDAMSGALTMSDAARAAGLQYHTFRRRCLELGVKLKPNQGGKGGTHARSKPFEQMRDRACIKRRMIEEGVEHACALCGCLPTWNGLPLSLQLDHIDGDRKNNQQSNLRLLCPNCHSQTPTWGVRNRKTNRK